MADLAHTLNWKDRLDPESVAFTTPEIMAKFVATVDSAGYPHLSMITSNCAISPTATKWGEFTRGMSKGNVVKNPKQGLLFMTAQMPFEFLQIKATLDHVSLEGEDAVDFNQMALFRYNTYMRVYRVFFNSVVAARSIRGISLMGITKGILKGFGSKGNKGQQETARLNPLGRRLFNGAVFPKFIAYIDSDGYPIIIPCFQARSADGIRIYIPTTQFKEDLACIPPGSKVSMFAMDFETVSQMVKGTLIDSNPKNLLVDIEWVYNSMPPKVGTIYPKIEVLEKVSDFS